MNEPDEYEEWADAQLLIEHEDHPERFLKCPPLTPSKHTLTKPSTAQSDNSPLTPNGLTACGNSSSSGIAAVNYQNHDRYNNHSNPLDDPSSHHAKTFSRIKKMKRSDLYFNRAVRASMTSAALLAGSITTGIWSIRAGMDSQGLAALMILGTAAGFGFAYSQAVSAFYLFRRCDRELRNERERAFRRTI